MPFFCSRSCLLSIDNIGKFLQWTTENWNIEVMVDLFICTLFPVFVSFDAPRGIAKSDCLIRRYGIRHYVSLCMFLMYIECSSGATVVCIATNITVFFTTFLFCSTGFNFSFSLGCKPSSTWKFGRDIFLHR